MLWSMTFMLIRSVMVIGSSRNFLMVNVPPYGDTSRRKVADNLCLPGRVPCTIGNAVEMCLPDM